MSQELNYQAIIDIQGFPQLVSAIHLPPPPISVWFTLVLSASALLLKTFSIYMIIINV